MDESKTQPSSSTSASTSPKQSILKNKNVMYAIFIIIVLIILVILYVFRKRVFNKKTNETNDSSESESSDSEDYNIKKEISNLKKLQASLLK